MKTLFKILIPLILLFSLNAQADTVFNDYEDLGASPASDDELIVWDTSEGEVKNFDYSYILPGIDDNSASVALTIDASQRLLVGDTANRAVGTTDPSLQITGVTTDTSAVSIQHFINNNLGPTLTFGKAHVGTIGTYTIVQDNDLLGTIDFNAADGTDMASTGGTIFARINGTPGANDVPTELVFGTTQDGDAQPTVGLILDSTQRLTVGEGAVPNFPVVMYAGTGATYLLHIWNDGNNLARGGMKIQAGADAPADGTKYITFSDGDDDERGEIEELAGSIAYSLSSDRRMKKNIVDSTINGLDIVNGIQIRAYDWKKSGAHDEAGIIAQELKMVAPFAVSGNETLTQEYEAERARGDIVDNKGGIIESDIDIRTYNRDKSKKGKGKFVVTTEPVMGTRAKMMGISRERLVPVLIKAIQELTARLEVLEQNQ